MPKKPARNAFYFFMEDFRREQEKKGIKYKTTKDACDAAGPIWDKMPAPGKSKYIAKANAEKQKMNTPVMKFTSLGESLADIEQRHKDLMLSEQREVNEIKLLVQPRDSLVTQRFFLIDVNYYCKTTTDYVFCEYTILRFNLLDGIIDELHEIINPGEIPMGYTSDAQLGSIDLAIKLPDPNDERTSYPITLAGIEEQLEEDQPNPSKNKAKREPSIYTVFTMPEKVGAVNNFFDQLLDISMGDTKFRVYKLDTLFYHLINNVRKDPNTEGFPSKALALIQLNKDTFQYYPKLACDHHESTEKFLNCTSSRVKRWSFTIMDHCCPLQQIKMAPGKHLPNAMDLEGVLAVREGINDRWEEQSQRREEQNEWREGAVGRKYDGVHDAASDVSGSVHNAWQSVAGSDVTSTSKKYPNLRPPSSASRNWVMATAPPNLTEESFPRLSGAGRGSSTSLASALAAKPGSSGAVSNGGPTSPQSSQPGPSGAGAGASYANPSAQPPITLGRGVGASLAASPPPQPGGLGRGFNAAAGPLSPQPGAYGRGNPGGYFELNQDSFPKLGSRGRGGSK